MKIKLEIHPSFLNSCNFEVDENSLIVTIQARSAADTNEENITWYFENIHNTYINKLRALTQKIIEESKLDKRMILDGVGLRCAIETNISKSEYSFRCPELNSPELELVLTYMNLFSQLKITNDLNNYLELLEGYFSNTQPFKEFNEEPYRLRIYGSLSIHEKKVTFEIINKVSAKENLVIDMTNFQGMGTALYECFTPLKKTKNLKFLVNTSSMTDLIKMGFEKEIMELINNN